MQQVIMTVGIPASGKSTWAKKWVLESSGGRKRINRDDLRLMVDSGVWSPDNEKFILKLRDQFVLASLRAGKSVVMGETKLSGDNCTKLCTLIRGAGLTAFVLEKMFPVDVDEAVARDAKRTPNVGEAVVRDMWKKFIGKHGKLRDPRTEAIVAAFSSNETIDRVEGIKDAIICDLDGTLALMGDRSPYDASRCDEVDLPNHPVIECVKAMHEAGHGVIFMSGREDKDRAATERFISKWVKGRNGDVIPHELFMRPTGDQRKDNIVKRELFDTCVRGKYNVRFCLDDRDQVVEGWRAMGLTCFQVQPGAF